MDNTKRLAEILDKFAACGWDLLEGPAKAYLAGGENREELVKALLQADAECGSCGCEFDPLYKEALRLLGAA